MVDQPHPVAARGAVIAGVVPGQSSRVVREAARYAGLAGAELIVVHVDTTRFVAFEDPDGYVPAGVDLAGTAAKAALDEVRREAEEALAGHTQVWSVRQEIGDPALALISFAVLPLVAVTHTAATPTDTPPLHAALPRAPAPPKERSSWSTPDPSPPA